jgi:hypothetical protein
MDEIAATGAVLVGRRTAEQIDRRRACSWRSSG